MRDFLRVKLPSLYNFLIFLNHSIFFWRFFRKSYSQFGEDLIVSHLFQGKGRGFYVDVGAHRPTQFSNTYFFYKRGWRGINIDAMPGSMKLFRIVRHRDINLEAAISGMKETKLYYSFNRPLQNGIYDDETVLNTPGLVLIEKREIVTQTLSSILDSHLPKEVTIDILSIDVEGLDLAVLKSNNWSKYKPRVILVEILNFNMEMLKDHEVSKFLSEAGYVFYSRTVHTIIFIENEMAAGLLQKET